MKRESPGKQWNHPKVQLYQLRMKRRATRAERRFDDILDEALKAFSLPFYKATQAKQTKWLRKRRKFKKQRIFLDQVCQKAYIVDFYIPELKLAIEVDGNEHSRPDHQAYDAIRTSFLVSRGIKVVRFGNDETLNFGVCKQKVEDICKARTFDLRLLEPVEGRSGCKHTSKELGEMTQAFLQEGGKIKVFRSRADEIAANMIPTGKYCHRDAYFAELKRRKAINWKRRVWRVED